MSDTRACNFCGQSETGIGWTGRSEAAVICFYCLDLCRDILAERDEDEPTNPELVCAFCGKDRRTAAVAGPNWVYICDECVAGFQPFSG